MSLSSVRIKCPIAECSFTQVPTEIRKHLVRVHKYSKTDIDSFKDSQKAAKAIPRGTDVHLCESCGKKFTAKKSLTNHIRNEHNSMLKNLENPADISIVDCNDREPIHKRSCIRPEKMAPLTFEESAYVEKEISNQKLLCPHENCRENVFVAKSRTLLCAHFEEHHKEVDMLEVKSFDNKEEFEMWKSKREAATMTTFKKRNKERDGKREVCFYECQHQGSYEIMGKQRTQEISKKKTGCHLCTAFMTTKEIDGVLKVSACFRHIRHEVAAHSLGLTTTQKNTVSGLVEQGFRSEWIVRKMGEEYNENDRLHYHTSDDLRNLKNRYNLNEGQLHSDDLTSVKMLVEKGEQSNGIRLFQEPDKDGMGFVLVIIDPYHLENLKRFAHKIIVMDDTHNLTKYGLKLTTCLVVDNLDRGAPAGFLLSSSTTSIEVQLFFEQVKKLIPDFNPQFMMTDEAASFYNGFSAVFPLSHAKKTLCRWHVFRSWKKKAKQLLKGPLLNDTLCSLREAIREPRKERLKLRILSLLQSLDEEGSPGSLAFSQYFHTYYFGRIDEWSNTARDRITCQTSMMAESWHSILKKQIIGNKKGVRVDRLLAFLKTACEYIRTKNSVQAARHLAKGCPRRAQNRTKCRIAEKERSNYLVENFSDFYSVTNLVNGNVYEVHDHLACFCDKEENTHCTFCNACYYRYSCDCLHQISGVACKHTHLVILSIRNYQRNELEGALTEPLSNENIPLPFENFEDDAAVDDFEQFGIIQSSRCSADDAEDLDQSLLKMKTTFDMLYTSLRKQVKNKDSSVEAKICELQKTMENLLGPVEASNKLVERADAFDRKFTARETMHTGTLQKRQKKRTQESGRPVLVHRIKLNRCFICGLQDDQMPEDTDDYEAEAQLTAWKRCAMCHSPVHLTCAMTEKCCECSPHSTFENYPPNFFENDSEDSD